ncbi:maleylpyruvate isomerase N-terminal domain-containing protein [Plantactinospora sonchi]|uniref:DinB family protein n=1 Tax=Plantactinospora sonchi TaxID=1544735 RepID=A0ABU7RMD8_9ACTN
MNADEVRDRNAELDDRILSTVDSVHPGRLHVLEAKPDGVEAWSAAMVLAHVAEFSRFFADELRRFLADPAAPVGRTHEHPERLAAVAAAGSRSLDDLRADLTAAFANLAAALDAVRDDHLTMVRVNRRYGPEPLTAFLDRYVLGHKQSHAEQLADLVEEAR